ncbi:MAG: hypothetical protein AAF004_01335 [Pseudomonadota bacterium]
MSDTSPPSQPSPLSWRHTWKFIVAEMLAIVFGVFLGLWVSDMQDDSEIDEFVERSRVVILQELSDNFTRISTSRAYHLKVLPMLIAARDAMAKGERVPDAGYRGMGLAPVTKAAYDTALAAGVFTRIDPQEATAIAYAYEKIASMRGVIEDYRLAVATNDGDFLMLVSTAFGDALYAEDAALAAIAPLVDKSAPPEWTTLVNVAPY